MEKRIVKHIFEKTSSLSESSAKNRAENFFQTIKGKDISNLKFDWNYYLELSELIEEEIVSRVTSDFNRPEEKKKPLKEVWKDINEILND